MKTMIFSGRTLREAMALAKQRFGADIDILNSDQVGDEVQVTVVVPETSTPGRRRKAVERVSASIKARADAPMKGERVKAPVKGIEAAADERAGAEENEQADAESVADGAGARAGRAVRASKTAKGGKTAATRKSGKGASAAADKTPEIDGKDTEAGVDAVAGSQAGQEDDAPLSTLDFERQRRVRQAKGEVSGAREAGEPRPTQASSLVQALVAAQTARSVQTVVKPAVSGAAQGASASLAGMAGTAACSTDTATTAGAWRMAGQAPGPSADQGSSPTQATTAPAGASGASAGDATGSRLLLVLGSARRMLGSAPGRWLGRGTTETVSAPATAISPEPARVVSAAGGGFGQEAPMPLSSLLQTGESDWPSLSLQTDGDDVEAAEAGEEVGAQAPDASARTSGNGVRVGMGRSRDSRLDGIGWFEAARRRPAQMRLLRNLLSCQFSPALARTLVGLLPVDYSDVQADQWLRQMMLRALAGVNGRAGILPGHTAQTIFDQGGVFALIGPTGVGKTTSIAKIAAHHVLRHGPKSLALITADVYRIGAQEQLRAFGKMLGVPVQVAQDRDVLQSLLKEHEDRSLVLIDTAGISQRDERVSQLTSALALSQVRRVLVLNAGTQPGGIEDVLRAFGASQTAGVLLSKVDEAVGLGPCFDALIRHRLPLVGYTDGQRVPEDYHPANLGQLIESALSAEATNRYPSLSMTDSEIRHLFEGAHV